MQAWLAGPVTYISDGVKLKEYINPESLNFCNRFDILAKLVYARLRQKNVQSDWHRNLYLENIRVFNSFYEHDGSGKYGKDAFINSFDTVLDSISEHGYLEDQDPVVVGVDGTPVTGAHRVAACIQYNKNIWIERIQEPGPVFDYSYFRKYGLTEKWSDPAALEFCRRNTGAFVALLYPAARGEGKEAHAREIIGHAGNIFYAKDVDLTKNGSINFIRQVYKGAPWVGNWKDGYSGARSKAGFCFDGEGPLRMFVIESNLDAMLTAKLEIRDLYGIENHSIHTTDTREECLRLGQQLLNDNSIRFLNVAVGKDLKNFDGYFRNYRQWLDESGFDRDDFCIDGSAVMSAYGIRDARDLDYIHLGDSSIDCNNPDIGNHNSELAHHPCSKDELILNPDNYFYYDGVKFVTLSVIRSMKASRDEPKDRIDVRLIDAFAEGMGEPFWLLLRQRVRQVFSRAYLVGKLRGLKMKADMYLYRFIRRMKSW